VQSTYKHLADLIAEAKLHADVDSTYTLDEYNDAFSHAKKHGRDGKVLFRF
jgi:NADPH:quinone reductase-like Zn-dependent oxidoreductase